MFRILRVQQISQGESASTMRFAAIAVLAGLLGTTLAAVPNRPRVYPNTSMTCQDFHFDFWIRLSISQTPSLDPPKRSFLQFLLREPSFVIDKRKVLDISIVSCHDKEQWKAPRTRTCEGD